MDFALFVILHLMAILSPGPTLVGMMTFSLNNGFKKTLPFVLGIALGNLLFSLIAILGLSEMIFKNVALKASFYLIGGGFLIFFGLKLLRKSKPEKQITIDKNTAFFTGFMIEILNPKSILFTASLFALFIKPESILFLKVLAVFWVVVVGFAYECLIVFLFSTFKKSILKIMSYLNNIFAILLVFFGSRFMFWGFLAII